MRGAGGTSGGLGQFFIGLIMMIGTLFLFVKFKGSHDLVYAQTVAFSTLVMFQLWNVLNAKAESESLFSVGIFTNKMLWIAIASSFILQLVVIYSPLNGLFHTTPIALIDWGIIFMVSASVFVLVEIAKLFKVIKT